MRTSFKLVLVLSLLSIDISTATAVAADEIQDLRYENEVLESELALAQKAQVYFIFNLKDKKIYLKTRGATKKELPIDQIKGWNLPLSARPHPLLKKSSLFRPRREEIDPKQKETAATDKFEIDALELDDMPSRFNLILDDGLVVTIRSKPVGILSYLESGASSLGLYVSRPLFTLWGHLSKRPYSSLYVSMDKIDAQSLYWSFYEGSQSIIYNP